VSNWGQPSSFTLVSLRRLPSATPSTAPCTMYEYDKKWDQ
jgi:hypothetical protein